MHFQLSYWLEFFQVNKRWRKQHSPNNCPGHFCGSRDIVPKFHCVQSMMQTLSGTIFLKQKKSQNETRKELCYNYSPVLQSKCIWYSNSSTYSCLISLVKLDPFPVSIMAVKMHLWLFTKKITSFFFPWLKESGCCVWYLTQACFVSAQE